MTKCWTTKNVYNNFPSKSQGESKSFENQNFLMPQRKLDKNIGERWWGGETIKIGKKIMSDRLTMKEQSNESKCKL